MPALREQDFDKLAAQVVDEFLSKRAKLADAAAKVAQQNGLNPDQIERLTQSANTMTFLRMMENAKAAGATDLTQEFDPIDSRHVIKIVIDNTGVHIDPGPGADIQQGQHGQEELPNEMAAVRGGMPPNAEHEAQESPKVEKEEHESPKEAGFRIMRTRKLAGVLEDQLRQAHLLFDETHEKLAARFKRLSNLNGFDAFEKDALADHGDTYGIAVLNSLRETRNMPLLSDADGFRKSAALADHHVTEETVELTLFGDLVKTAREAHRLAQGIAFLRTQCA